MGEYTDRIKTIYLTRKKQLITKYWPIRSTPETTFIILCKPRTGSTLLHTLLNSHPNIYSYGEVLRRVAINNTGYAVNKDVFKKHPKSIKAVGLKVFYQYSEDEQFKVFFDEIRQNRKVKIIHLKRLNDLDTFVSLKHAEFTNQWSKNNYSPDTKVSGLKPELFELKDYLMESVQLKKSISEAFGKHQCLNVQYEKLVNDQFDCLQKIQDFLKVPQKKLFTILKKQGPGNYDHVSNYSELSAFYESFRE
ncbi:MAG: sulfotransferase [Bacteroidota bacterium]